MPLFDYKCTNCKEVTEILTSNTNQQSINCPVCGREATKVTPIVHAQFNGEGWPGADSKYLPGQARPAK